MTMEIYGLLGLTVGIVFGYILFKLILEQIQSPTITHSVFPST